MTIKQNDKKAGRSISYPAISLPTAIERAEKLWAEAKKNSIPFIVAAKCWGYSEKSSGAKGSLAALISFGLLEPIGSGASRQVKLTERAIRIIMAPDEISKKGAISDAAVSPKIYDEILAKWKDDLPSDAMLNYYLINDRSFNANSVKDFIRDFRETMEFAKLNGSGIMSLSDESNTKQVQEYEDVGRLVNNIRPDAGLPLTNNATEEVYHCEDGEKIVIRWPSKYKDKNLEDIKAWLDILARKIIRSRITEAMEV